MRALPGVICCLFLLAFPAISDATNLRGRLDRVSSFGAAPAVGIAVTVSSPQVGRSVPAYADRYGFYYLYNIPPGLYNLEIWVANPPMTYSVQVPPIPQYDLAPIRVP